MSTYNIDDILNANDSDEDVDATSVDLEKLLDDDDESEEDYMAGGRFSPNIYSSSEDDDSETGQVQPPPPSELFTSEGVKTISPPPVDPALDELLREEDDEATDMSPTARGDSSLSHSHSNPLHTLELAEKREKRIMLTCDKEAATALQSKLDSNFFMHDQATQNNKDLGNDDKNFSKNNISHFKCVCLEMISTQLRRNAQFKQHGPGVATVVRFTTKFIAIGTTRGLILIFDHNQEMRQVIGSSVPASGRSVCAVTALDVSASGEVIFSGYENGEITIWDLTKGTVIKRMADLLSGRIDKLCLVYGIGEDAPSLPGISSEYSLIAVDSKGVVIKTKLSKSLFMSISVDSECLLDGSAGAILDLCQLPSFSTLSSYPSIINEEDETRSVQPSKSSITDCPAYAARTDQYIALNSSVRSYIIRVYPQVKILYRWAAPHDVVQNSKSTPTDSNHDSEAEPREEEPKRAPAPVNNSVSLDWTWMPSSYYSELKVASSHAKSLVNPRGPVIHPVIVRGWGKTIEILALVPPSSSSSDDAPAPEIEALNLAKYVLPNNILSVKWMSNHTSIVVMTTREVLVLNIPSFSSERLPVSKDVEEILCCHAATRSTDNIPAVSICVSRERMYLLATDKMYMFYLQSWQEQAEQLLSEGQWLDALALVLERHKNLPQSLSSTQLAKEEMYLKDYIKRYVDLAIVRTNTAAHPSSIAPSADSAGRGRSGHHYLVACICIEYCLLGGGSLIDMLFGDIYTGFTSAQQQSIFMEALEPFIIKRQITDLPTKLFSELVDYCNRAQQFSLLERMVCHLDLTDVDMDTLVKTLKRGRLYSGFLYVHAYGLNDFSGAFQSVFEDMLLTSGSKGVTYQFPSPHQVDIGYKLILFALYAANGEVFPRGGKTVVSAPCLTQLVELMICKQYPPSPRSSTSNGDTNPSTSTFSMTSAALTSPQMNFSYPFLFSLSKIDLYALFHTLAKAFQTIYGNSDNGNIVKLNRNNLYFESFGAMFSAVLNFAKYADSHSNSKRVDSGASSYAIAHQLCFFELFLELITSCNVQFSMDFLQAVIQHCEKFVKPLDDSESRVNALISRQTKYLQPSSRVYEALASELEQHSFFMPALTLCSASSKHRYKPSSDTLRKAIICYVHKNSSSPDFALRIFSYIHKFFEQLDNTGNTAAEIQDQEKLEARMRECSAVLIEFIQELAGVSTAQTQTLMVMYLCEQVDAVMEKTKKHQKLQFDLLDAMVRGVKSISTSPQEHMAQGSDASTPHEDKQEHHTSDEDLLLPATPLADKHVMVFISQLATFHPPQVLGFLSTHTNYPLDEALVVCKQRCIFDATAYLLERAGDSTAALELCLMEIAKVMPTFVDKAEEMASDALHVSLSNKSGSLSSTSTSSSGMTLAKSMLLLHLLKNPSPSKIMELFQHLEEYKKFNEIVHMVTAICSRIDSKSSSSYSHWFHVLDELLKVKHSLVTTQSTGSVRDSILQELSSGDSAPQMAKELVGLVVGQALKSFMSQMGGTVPSQDIVRRITQEEMMGSRFSEFKDVMISMVDSYSYEISLFKTCLRISTSDLLLMRAKRMKQKHRGVRCSTDMKLAHGDQDRDGGLPAALQGVSHSSGSHVGGLVRRVVEYEGKKEAFQEATNVIDLAARMVISTELPPVDSMRMTNADSDDERAPGKLPLEAAFVASYQGDSSW